VKYVESFGLKGFRDYSGNYQVYINEAVSRYTGANGRDFLEEAEQELLDCINCCVYQVLRLRVIRESLGWK